MQRFYALLVVVMLLFGLSAVQADDPDPVEARLFKVQQFLAKSGDPAGQYYLAEMYEKGLGTPQDMQQALLWYKKSAELGNPKAEEKLANWDKNLENARKAKERADTDAKAAELAKVKQQEEAEAAAKAKARATAEATRKAAEQAKTAEQSRVTELAKVKQQEEAEAAAKAKARAAEAARKTTAEPVMPKTTSTSSTNNPKTAGAKTPPAGTPPANEKTPHGTAAADSKENNDPDVFTTNPCKGPQAKFLSTCR